MRAAVAGPRPASAAPARCAPPCSSSPSSRARRAAPPPPPARRRRRAGAARAGGEGEGSASDGEAAVGAAPADPAVPDAPPPPSAAGGALTPDEIARLASAVRADKAAAAAKQQSLVEGVLEEVGLISWPSPGGALLNTLLVIGIVAATSALLFAVNGALSEASRLVYASGRL